MKGLIALATLGVAGVAAVVLAMSDGSADETAIVAAGAAAPLQPFPAVAASAAAAQPEPGRPASSAAGSALAASQPEGPARVETRNEGLAALPGMAAAAEAVAAQRAAASTAAASPSAPSAASAPRRTKPRTAVASKPGNGASARNRTETTADTPSRDPDAELVAAIMARLESPKAPTGGRATPPAASDRSSTIASLVRDCNAMADTASARACRQRICEGYWGKAQACPKSMAPAATSGGTASAQ